MSRAEKRRRNKKARKEAGKAAKSAKPAQPASPSPGQQTLTIPQALDLAVQHHAQGRLPEVEGVCQRILQTDPNQPVALHLLGVIAHQVGNNDQAAGLITKALAVKPDYPEAHYDLGIVLKEMGKPEDAVASYRKALAIKPDYFEAHNNLGIALHDLGKLDDAVASFHKALAIKPDYAVSHYNLGNALGDLEKLEEAVANYRKALAIKPDYFDAHNNLGNVLIKLGKLEEAAASFNKAIAIKPDYTDAHFNLGLVQKDLGRLDEAIISFHKALALNPDHPMAWNGLTGTAKALLYSRVEEGWEGVSYKDGLSENARANPGLAMLEYVLDSFRPHEADESFRKAMASLPPRIDEELTIKEEGREPANPHRLAGKLVALLHFGRSGTGLLHSLIDGHPEVSTLPSIYLRGFFNDGVWSKIATDGWRRLPERFADEFAVLFDANSPKPTPGRHGEDSSYLGQKEGMANVGENRDESLSLDRDRFCSEALRLIKGLGKIDPRLFLLVVHSAFEKVMKTKKKKHTILYHIHNLDTFAELNFLRHVPDARLILMVREPIQSCESWVRHNFVGNDYLNIVFQINTMLFAFDQVAFRMQDSVGVRLEDLKSHPEATLRALSAWLGIQETPSLFEMTAQGKKWWGDPSSPDYDANKGMSAFGEGPSKHALGTVFSEQDRFILRTLFYPFCVRFGYREPDPARFEKDLKKIRPLFDDMLDFEKVMSERAKIDPAQFRRSTAYKLLRASFVDRWEVLNEFKEYPNMISPLDVTTE